ncbi:hypothetical protein T265_11633 [Opisthorchis viverrini]|uniref:Aminomethyltransferase n=2 Tax=Opisthorchis viverrini TaxID=6198 RepID=A0A074Z2E2_OPIVI|nr:hypothetical protein T265_11633 [Opisthorchis viverrini]KER19647.1 hypothetical protein T265_11633 [Opisthorchis viverrini]
MLVKFRSHAVRLAWCRYIVRTNSTGALRTPFYDFHISHGAKIVDFCGFSLPIQYAQQNILDSHNYVRKNCGIFDVSHMLQVRIHGADRLYFMESLTSSDLLNLPPGTGTLSVYLKDDGGILDDLIINKCTEPYLYVVSNAACAEKITSHLRMKQIEFSQSGKDATVEFLGRYALLAVQGPESYNILRQNTDTEGQRILDNLYFMESSIIPSLFGLNDSSDPIRITRCGYTGEDGYEISVPDKLALELANRMMETRRVKPIGLAARDTLRLEAGMCLYGNDLSESVTPVEASLSWLVGKRRRQASSDPPIRGGKKILAQLKDKAQVSERRIGIAGGTGPQARTGAKIFSDKIDGPVGQVTSGCLSPTLGRNIAMAYVKSEFTNPGEKLHVEIRQKLYPFTVTSLPFVPNRYVRRPKNN